jgi:class 3 adenylate cyclase
VQQQIRFCNAADGTCIAYAVLDGGGPTVLYAAGFPTNLEMEWSAPNSRAMLESLADGARLVRYDMRGCGLSERDAGDFSLDALVADLEAVADAGGAGTFALISMGMLGGPTAVAYAAAHPERVTRLVVCSGFLRGARVATPERQSAVIEYTEKFGFPVMEYVESDDPAASFDKTGRDAVHLSSTPDVQAALLRTMYALDLAPLLPRLAMPVTVLHGRNDRLVPFEQGRALAAGIAHADFVPLGGNTGAALTERNSTVPAIRRALGLDAGDRTPGAPALRTVLFTDLVQHSEMMQRLGDDRGRELLREHERITRETLRRHGGQEVKSMGDGFMASFGSVTRAVECAIELQRAFAGWNAAASAERPPLHVRVGLNAGEPIEDDGDLFGATVILAARICAQADGGEVLIPEPVRHLLAGKGFVFSDRGEFAPKGFDDAVRLYSLRVDP